MTLKEKMLQLAIVVDNEYLDKYVELILQNKNTAKTKFVTQAHHIIPKYAYKALKLKIDNSSENLVQLKYCDHLLAHYYLARCSSSTIFELANLNAIYKNNNNPHSVDLETWLKENADMLNTINKRRCELISLHHADVANEKNPRAAQVHQYSVSGEYIKSFSSIKQCAEEIEYSPDSLRSLLSKNRVFTCQDKLFLKSKLTKSDLANIIVKQKNEALHKRSSHEFVCQQCGKAYTLLLNEEKWQLAKDSQHYCAACTKSGIIFLNKAKSADQKQKMHDSCQSRMHKVCCVETGEIFESVTAACRKYSNNIKRCLAGKQKTCAGYHWKRC